MKKSKEDLIKEELLNKEIELLELDNYLQDLGAVNSIYEGDTEQFIKDKNFVYWFKDFKDKEILIHFDIVNNEDPLYVDVKITKIETI